MNRALKLRRLQLLHDAKWPTIIALFLVAIILLDKFILDAGSTIIQTGSESNLPIALYMIEVFLLIVSINIFCIPILDGTSHFDSALRFGVPRQQYFGINIILYVIISIINIIIKTIGDGSAWNGAYGEYFMHAFSQLNWENIVVNYVGVMISVLFMYGFYKFGWKIFLTLLILPVFGMLTAGLSSIESVMLVFNKLAEIFNFFSEYSDIIIVGLALVLTALYYRVVTKFEIQD